VQRDSPIEALQIRVPGFRFVGIMRQKYWSIYMLATFPILIGFVVLSHWSAGRSLAKTLEGAGFILALFTCVVLHEFGMRCCSLSQGSLAIHS